MEESRKKKNFLETLADGGILGLAAFGTIYIASELGGREESDIIRNGTAGIYGKSNPEENIRNRSPKVLSSDGLRMIKSFEGFRGKPYYDATGKLTIGYGHLVRNGESFTEIDDNRAEELLREDASSAERTVRELVKVRLTQSQYDALVSFVYNLGAENFRTSTLLRKLNYGDREGAAEEFKRWVHAGGKKLKGLENRRAKERELFLRN